MLRKLYSHTQSGSDSSAYWWGVEEEEGGKRGGDKTIYNKKKSPNILSKIDNGDDGVSLLHGIFICSFRFSGLIKECDHTFFFFFFNKVLNVI